MSTLLFTISLYGFCGLVLAALHVGDKVQTMAHRIQELENQVSKSNQ